MPGDSEQPKPPPSADGATTPGWYGLLGIGFEFLASVCVFGAIGWWADARLKTLPWLTIAGAAVGFAAGLTLMIRAARGAFKD